MSETIDLHDNADCIEIQDSDENVLSSDSDECLIIPNNKECDRLCNEFASISETNTALAMYYLQDRDWDLQRSLAAYFVDNPSAMLRDVLKRGTSVKQGLVVISWNIDGNDYRELERRTEAVVQTVKNIQPDVVFLQEVVPKTHEIIRQHLYSDYWHAFQNNYEPRPSASATPPSHSNAPPASVYYVGILVKKSAIDERVEPSIEDIPFKGSVMDRALFIARMSIYGVPMTLMTSHLESTAEFSEERRCQLKQCFAMLRSAPPQDHVIFAGDLNLRDKEVGPLPVDTNDLWAVNGSKQEVKYTWDARRNSNINMDSFARCRFDRAYMRKSNCSTSSSSSSSSSHDTDVNSGDERQQKKAIVKNKDNNNKECSLKQLQPVNFGLIGLEKIPRSQRFPSDHWGIINYFKILGV